MIACTLQCLAAIQLMTSDVNHMCDVTARRELCLHMAIGFMKYTLYVHPKGNDSKKHVRTHAVFCHISWCSIYSLNESHLRCHRDHTPALVLHFQYMLTLSCIITSMSSAKTHTLYIADLSLSLLYIYIYDVSRVLMTFNGFLTDQICNNVEDV